VRVQRDISERGYYYGRGWESGDVLTAAHNLGRARGDTRDPSIVRPVSPTMSSDAKTNTLSSRYGFGEFPLHTETAYWRRPARFLALRCVNPGRGSRTTTVLDSESLDIGVDEWQLLQHEIWKVQRRQPFLCTLVERRDEQIALRFDRECMVPATRGAHRANSIMLHALEHARPVHVSWSPGDLLIIDNYRCLHGRGASVVSDEDRVLERILIGVPV
jgi:hypothetical protein